MLKALECTKGIFFISYIIQLPERNGKQLLSLSMLCAGWIVGFSVHQLSTNRSPLKLRSTSASKTSFWTYDQGNANDPCRDPGQILLSVTWIGSSNARLSEAYSALWEQNSLSAPLQTTYPLHFFSTDQLHITLNPQQIPLPQSEHQSLPKTLKCYISANIIPNTWIAKNMVTASSLTMAFKPDPEILRGGGTSIKS